MYAVVDEALRLLFVDPIPVALSLEPCADDMPHPVAACRSHEISLAVLACMPRCGQLPACFSGSNAEAANLGVLPFCNSCKRKNRDVAHSNMIPFCLKLPRFVQKHLKKSSFSWMCKKAAKVRKSSSLASVEPCPSGEQLS